MSNIADIKQLAVEGWVDFAGQIKEIKETKQRVKSDMSKTPGQQYSVTKLTVADMSDKISVWAYTQTFMIGSLVSGRGQLKIHPTGNRYIDYATIKISTTGQSAPPGQQQHPQKPQVQDGSNGEIVRIRSMAVAYAKDLVCGDKIDLSSLYSIAENFTNYIIEGNWERQKVKETVNQDNREYDNQPVDDQDIPF